MSRISLVGGAVVDTSAVGGAVVGRAGSAAIAIALVFGAILIGWSSPAEAQTGVPVAPEFCTVTIDGSTATIKLKESSGGGSYKYLLYRSEDGGPSQWSASVVSTELTDFDLVRGSTAFTWEQTPGVTYAYEVQTRNLLGDFSGRTPCADVTRPPGAALPPADCAATATVDANRTIEFNRSMSPPGQDAGDNASRFLLYRSEDGGAWQWSGSIAATAPQTFTWVETPGVEYAYGVKTRGTDGRFTALTECTVDSRPTYPAPACESMQSGSKTTIAWEPNGAPNWYLSTYDYDYWNQSFVEIDGNAAHYTYAESRRYSYALMTREGRPTNDAVGDLVAAFCGPAADILPVDPPSCSVVVASDGRVTVNWTPADGDAVDRHVIYGRDAAIANGTWQGSVGPGESSFTKSGLSNPSNYGWLVKARATLADGTRVFSDGTTCTGTAIDYVAGDDVAAAFPIAGEISVDGSTVLATLEDGEGSVTFPNQAPGCSAYGLDAGNDDFDGASLRSSIWYAWTPGGSGTFEFALDNASFLRSVAVYAPTSAVTDVADIAGTEVGCRRAVSPDSPVAIDVTDPAAVYYVQVFGERYFPYRSTSSVGEGSYTLIITAPGGTVAPVVPVGPMSCSVEIVNGQPVVSWTPIAGDPTDRYVIYAREQTRPNPEWQGSVAPTVRTFTKSGLQNPADYAWLVKARTTLVDGTRLFGDGVVCSGSAYDYLLPS